mmetsp:Transcript_14362/g.19656  ORF Transcript_14362/g.19656 Transcript_14362/m.19656 type:complete len:101 (-) Transcript_14362:3775-4077(-)
MVLESVPTLDSKCRHKGKCLFTGTVIVFMSAISCCMCAHYSQEPNKPRRCSVLYKLLETVEDCCVDATRFAVADAGDSPEDGHPGSLVRGGVTVIGVGGL